MFDFNLSEEQEERAKRLHRESIVVDTLRPLLSCSQQYTPGMRKRLDELLKEDASIQRIDNEIERVLAEELISGVSDIEREWLEIGGVDVLQATVGYPMTSSLFEGGLTAAALWQRKIDSLDYWVKATTFRHVEQAKAQGKRAIIFGCQDTEQFGRDLEKLQLFYDLGFRVIQLTYNVRNYVGDGYGERADGGLSQFGVKLLKRLNELGIIVDLSHVGHRTSLDAIELSSSPPIVTHGFARKLWNNPRGTTDDIIKAIADRNGYFAVMMPPIMLTGVSGGVEKKECAVNDILDHVDHVVGIMGADKVGFGSDFHGGRIPALRSKFRDMVTSKRQITDRQAAEGYRPNFATWELEGFRDIRDWPNWTRGLVSRGYSDDEIKGILGGNFLRIFKQVCG